MSPHEIGLVRAMRLLPLWLSLIRLIVLLLAIVDFCFAAVQVLSIVDWYDIYLVQLVHQRYMSTTLMISHCDTPNLSPVDSMQNLLYSNRIMYNSNRWTFYIAIKLMTNVYHCRLEYHIGLKHVDYLCNIRSRHNSHSDPDTKYVPFWHYVDVYVLSNSLSPVFVLYSEDNSCISVYGQQKREKQSCVLNDVTHIPPRLLVLAS
jgi:hypothetical protein